MTRFKADALLLLTAIIWGAAFVSQKSGMDDVGPFTFIASRFIISLVLVLPFALHEARHAPPVSRNAWPIILITAGAFAAGMTLQQLGIQTTSVTNAGFLTGLYVVITPFIAWILLKRRPRFAVWIGALVSIIGVYLLTAQPSASSGASTTGAGVFQGLGIGDAQIIVSAALLALQISLLGLVLPKTPRPILIMLVQCAVTIAVALPVALATETITTATLWAAAPEIAYAGVLAGALGFSLQAIAQQYSPPSDAAIIMSSEALWAALAGVLLLGEVLPPSGIMGCACIFAAILMVELIPGRNLKRSARASDATSAPN